MIRPLVLKELREHRWVLLALWVLSAVGLLGLLQTAKDEGSPLAAFRSLAYFLGSVSILMLANRLVVREYTGRTQLFLETLPVSRVEIIAVKWLTGAVLLAIPMAVGFGVILHVAAAQVVLTTRFTELIWIRGATFLLFGYSLAFLIALSGRYRYVLWGVLCLGVYAANSYGQSPWQQWAPFALVSNSMVFERVELPIADVMTTLMLSGMLIAATFCLSLAGEGSLVLALSRRMSPRERVFVTVVLISVFSLLAELEARKPKPAFQLLDAVTSGQGARRVAIARADKIPSRAAQELADWMSADLGDVQTYLSLGVLPGVFVLPDASIDPDVFLRAALPSSDGVVLRGAINAEDFEQQGFRAYAMEQSLLWYSSDRAAREDRRWVLDGFTQWLIARSSPPRRDLLTRRAVLAARILQMESTPLESQLRAWLTARERLGDCLSDALAWRGVDLLAKELGQDRFRQFTTTLFGRRLPGDERALKMESSFSDAWRKADAPEFSVFAQQLRPLLQAGPAPAGVSADMIAQRVMFEAADMGGGTFEVRYRFGAGDDSHQPFAVRYAEINPWQPEIDRETLARVDATRSGVLPQSYRRGTQLFTAIELRDSDLQCTVRLGARRWEIP